LSSHGSTSNIRSPVQPNLAKTRQPGQSSSPPATSFLCDNRFTCVGGHVDKQDALLQLLAGSILPFPQVLDKMTALLGLVMDKNENAGRGNRMQLIGRRWFGALEYLSNGFQSGLDRYNVKPAAIFGNCYDTTKIDRRVSG
jgi:hypothetical protein